MPGWLPEVWQAVHVRRQALGVAPLQGVPLTAGTPKPGTPEYDRGSISKLRAVKKANRDESQVNRMQGKDGRHTRDGGTSRRNWR